MSWFVPSFYVTVTAALLVAVVWLAASRRFLRADIARFAGFMEHGPFLAYMKDAEGRYVYENRAVVDLMQRLVPGTTTILGRTDHELFGPSTGEAYVNNDRLLIEQGAPMQFEDSTVDVDGKAQRWSTIKFPRKDARGRPCIAGISIDVTALHNARTDARSTADQASLALEAGRMGTLSLDLASGELETSPLFATLHGRPETKTRLTLEESLAEVHPEDRSKILNAVHEAIGDRAPSRINYRVVWPDRTLRWIELTGRVFSDESGSPKFVRGVGFDITEARTAFEELAQGKAMLRRLIEVQENERQTLCHDLHDGLIQYAIAAKMLLEAEIDIAADVAAVKRLDAAIQCLARGINEGRRVIRGVRPAVLDDLGLRAALDDLRDQMKDAEMAVHTALDEGVDQLHPKLCTTIFRVAQEAITNARKHSGAKQATLEVRRGDKEVHVRISDDGCGFDVEEARHKGFGLLGMAERVRLAGGNFSIESRPGDGTCINVRLPEHVWAQVEEN
jgi:signal transduction histidine kinase